MLSYIRFRVSMAILLAGVLIMSLIFLTGCASHPNRPAPPTASESEIALQAAVKIAVRHAVADSPRAMEKAQNIRVIVARLHSITSATSTLAALEGEVSAQIDKLDLSPVDRADAHDLLTLLSVAIEARVGPDVLQADDLVRINDFLLMVLAALPPETV